METRSLSRKPSTALGVVLSIAACIIVAVGVGQSAVYGDAGEDGSPLRGLLAQGWSESSTKAAEPEPTVIVRPKPTLIKTLSPLVIAKRNAAETETLPSRTAPSLADIIGGHQPKPSITILRPQRVPHSVPLLPPAQPKPVDLVVTTFELPVDSEPVSTQSPVPTKSFSPAFEPTDRRVPLIGPGLQALEGMLLEDELQAAETLQMIGGEG